VGRPAIGASPIGHRGSIDAWLRLFALAALASHPEKLLDEHWRAQTSYFERLQREHPHELNTGLQRLAHQLADGGAPARPGRASILVWQKTD
jgi:hypothetical protein